MNDQQTSNGEDTESVSSFQPTKKDFSKQNHASEAKNRSNLSPVLDHTAQRRQDG